MGTAQYMYVASQKMDPEMFSDLLLRAKVDSRTLTEYSGI